MREILKQMKDCDNDDEIKAIILTGTNGVFSVGADMLELSKVKNIGEVCSLLFLTVSWLTQSPFMHRTAHLQPLQNPR